MAFLRSYWIIAILSLAVSLGIVATLFLSFSEIFIPLPEPEREISEEEAVSGHYWSFRTQGIDSLVDELEKAKLRLKLREDELGVMQGQVQMEMEELKKMRVNIEKMRAELSQYITEVKEGEAKNLKQLAATYADMPPDSVVEIFSQMDDGLIVKILTYMKPDVIGALFDVMSKQGNTPQESAKRVAALTEKLRLRGKKV